MTVTSNRLAERLAPHRAVLMEGAVIERLRRETALELDPLVLNTALIYDPAGRQAMAGIYTQYLGIAADYRFPICMAAPTWRANPERIRRSLDRDAATVNRDAVRFMRDLCAPFDARHLPVIVGGLMACRGDAYKPEEALDSAAAETFHRPQAESLADAGVDYIMAATLPALSEAMGLARTLAALPVAYIISFVILGDGSILDGTPLPRAIAAIDAAVPVPPAFYMVNCVHPEIVRAGLGTQLEKDASLRARLWGIQANTSPKPPDALDESASLEGDPPQPFADALTALHHRYGLKILGGCCGTDHRHMAAVARRLSAGSPIDA